MSIHSQIVKSVMSSQLKTVRISDFVSFQQSVYGEQINNHRTHYLNQILGSDMICIANSTRSPKSHMHMATNFILKVKCHSGSCNLWGLPGGCSKIDNAFNLWDTCMNIQKVTSTWWPILHSRSNVILALAINGGYQGDVQKLTVHLICDTWVNMQKVTCTWRPILYSWSNIILALAIYGGLTRGMF